MIEQASNAAFLKNHDGEVCIALSDPAFVQSDSIVIDRDTHQVFAVFQAAGYFLGAMSSDMAAAFARNDHVLLSAERHDGSVFELSAPLTTSEWKRA